MRQGQQGVTTSLDVVEALQRGGGRAQHNRHIVMASPQHGDITAVIAGAILLFKRRVVLFINNDQPGCGQRQKGRRAGANDHLGLTLSGGVPTGQALARTQAGVIHPGHFAQTRLNAPNQLRAQANFRNQHQHLTATLHHPLGGTQIDLGFAASGHPGQHHHREMMACRQDGGHRPTLIDIELRTRPRWRRRPLGRFDPAFVLKLLQHRSTGPLFD